VTSSLAQQSAAVHQQMREEVTPLHTAIGISS
jgi:hypothetical protein